MAHYIEVSSFLLALTKGGATMFLLFLWWVFLAGCVVWAAGVAYLGFVIAKDVAAGERITVFEIFQVLIWPYELAKILFIAIMIAMDDSIG